MTSAEDNGGRGRQMRDCFQSIGGHGLGVRGPIALCSVCFDLKSAHKTSRTMYVVNNDVSSSDTYVQQYYVSGRVVWFAVMSRVAGVRFVCNFLLLHTVEDTFKRQGRAWAGLADRCINYNGK